MNVAFGFAALAGIAGTVVMTALMYMGKAMGMQMDMPRMLGLMFVGPERSGVVYGLGSMAHGMMGAVFGIAFAIAFALTGVAPGWGTGALFGLAHGVVAGMAMGMMPLMHPRMGEGKALAAPGLFGIRYGTMVPVGILMLHAVFGAVVGGLLAGCAV